MAQPAPPIEDIDLEAYDREQLIALRERIDVELRALQRERADDPVGVVESYLEDARHYFRGRSKMERSPNVGPAITSHDGAVVSVCYKGDTSRKNSVSRWLKINDEWIWESDRVVVEETVFPDFDTGYTGKVSVFALDLAIGDEVEIHDKKTHGSGSKHRTLYEFDGAEFQRV